MYTKAQYKQFKRLKHNEKLKASVFVVHSFINTNKFTTHIHDKMPNVINAAELILERSILLENDNIQLCKTFNKVLTLIHNNKENYNMIRRLNSHLIKQEGNTHFIGDYFIRTNDDEPFFSNKIDDLFMIYENNQYYMVMSRRDTFNNELAVAFKNIFGDDSVKVPLIKKENLNTAVLNGKDWVKHYTLQQEEGYLYFIKGKIENQIFYKVGISKSQNRFKYKQVKIIESNFIKMNMLKASIIEQYIHIKNTHKRLFIGDIDDTFEGKNECYHIDLQNNLDRINIIDCINTISAYKQYNKEILLYAYNFQNEGVK